MVSENASPNVVCQLQRRCVRSIRLPDTDLDPSDAQLLIGLGHLSLFCLKVVKVGYQNCCQFQGEHTKSTMDVPVKRTNESLDLSPCSSCGAEDGCKLIFIGFA